MSLKPEINFYGSNLATLYTVLYGPDPYNRMGNPLQRFFLDRQWHGCNNGHDPDLVWMMSTRRVNYKLTINRYAGKVFLQWTYKRGPRCGMFEIPLPQVSS